MPREDGYNRPGDFNAENTIVAEYLYRKADGSAYGLVKRTSEKRFLQFMYRQIADGGETNQANWRPGDQRPKIPYLLNWIQQASPDDTLYACEGEKDTDTLTDLGLYATCASGGVRGWTDDVSEEIVARFKKRIVIMEDNDKPGTYHVIKVAKSLRNCGFTGEIFIVDFRSSKIISYDVTDWVGDTDKMNKQQKQERKEEFLEYVKATEQPYTPDPLTIIYVNDGAFASLIDEIEHAMVKTHGKSHNIMFRGGHMVRPLWATHRNSDNVEFLATTLKPVKGWHAIADLLTKRVCEFKRWKEGKESQGQGKKAIKKRELIDINPPKEILTGLLSREYSKLPNVYGLLHSPSMRSDGSIISEEGFDEATGMYLCYSEYFNLPPVKDHPKHDDAIEALAILEDLLCEFPFVTDVDKATAISAILAAVCRCAFRICPLYIYLAPTASSGKSYLADVVSTIATGSECPVMTFVGGKYGDDENRKAIGAQIMSGAQMFSLDNLPSSIGGDFLCQVIERSLVEVRILGKSENVKCEWRGMIQATGNNTIVRGDMKRRVVICNLDPMVDEPEKRPFKQKPLKMVNADRAKYIWAALTIVRAYICNGKKVECEPYGSFNEWSKFCREPLMWLGLPDVLQNNKDARENDPEMERDFELIGLWEQFLKPNISYSVKHIFERISNERAGSEIGELEKFLVENCPSKMDKTKIGPNELGWMLRRIKNKVFGGWKLVMVRADHNGNMWALVRNAWRDNRDGSIANWQDQKRKAPENP